MHGSGEDLIIVNCMYMYSTGAYPAFWQGGNFQLIRNQSLKVVQLNSCPEGMCVSHLGETFLDVSSSTFCSFLFFLGFRSHFSISRQKVSEQQAWMFMRVREDSPSLDTVAGMQVQSNLSNTDTEGTEQSVRIREVSIVLRS